MNILVKTKLIIFKARLNITYFFNEKRKNERRRFILTRIFYILTLSLIHLHALEKHLDRARIDEIFSVRLFTVRTYLMKLLFY